MSEAWRSFHFLQPWWLLGWLAWPVLIGLAAHGGAAQRALGRLADAELLPHLLGGQERRVRLPSALLALGWTLGILALAGPTWSRISMPMFTERAAQVVALSLSQHMLASDVPPRRMERARYKARDLLLANQDGLNALIGYAGQAFVVAPLTSDAHSLDDLLQAMAPQVMPVDGDNAAQAIEQGVKLIHDANQGRGSIILVTDDADAAAQAAARAALPAGVSVSVLGIGTAQGVPIAKAGGGFVHDDQDRIAIARRNDQNLLALAQAGGGRYVAASANNADVAALHALLRPAQQAAAAQGQEADTWQDRGPWLLLPLLLVVAMAFRRGWVLLLPLVLLPWLPATVKATGWNDWWQRADQQAASALRQGDTGKARRLAQDPALRGVAAYRAKDYPAAIKAWQQAKGADAPYNLGNSLAQLGHYQDALKAYDRALQLNPHNADAQANRKLVEAAMRKQPAPSSSPPPPAGGQDGRDHSSTQAGPSSGQQPHGQGQPEGSADRPSSPAAEGQAKQDQARQAEAQKEHATQSDMSTGRGQPMQSPQRDRGGSSPQDDASRQAPAPASRSEQAQAAKAQQDLRAQLDRALADMSKHATAAPAHELGAVDNDSPLSKLPSNVRGDLQRVPDDPGALLRRKFQLQYRQRMGAQPMEGEQP